MGYIEMIITSFAVATDAFAVAICKGLSINKINIKKILIISLWFGIFQAIMPYIGFKLGSVFNDIILSIDHWIAFVLLLIIGLNMISETSQKENKLEEDLKFKTMLPLAIATSIDALAVGIAYLCAYKTDNYQETFLSIGIITFILTAIGVIIGYKFGNKLQKKSQIIGGIIIILIGIKILVSHLNII